MSDLAPEQGFATPVSDGVTAGLLLRRAREAAGLHVASLAVSLKVPVRKLEALEADRYELLTDMVFARGLASSVCRTLKIDPQPVLERLPQSAAPRLVQDRDGINTPFRAPGDVAGPAWYDQLPRPVSLTVFALLLGAAIILLWPAAQRDEPAAALPAQSAANPAVDVALSANVPAAPVLAMTMAIPVTAGASAPSVPAPAEARPQPVAPARVAAPPPAAAPASAPSAATVVLGPPAAATPAAVPAASPSSAPAVPAAAASGIVEFRTSAPSWVQVTDAKGNPVLKKLMAAGETAGVSGSLPLTVTVGSVNATQVRVRGKEFDLSRVSRDNVARFDIK
ncbi:MAG TPA: helix-turn-helix domain-containing protein [Ramlibacter sp.]|nr:helix-turn-helix domain-containing protein [Ramlibacter sp.]